MIHCHKKYKRTMVHTRYFSCQHIQAVSISVNAWSNAGHAVNHLYDILYMMGRDDIMVGIGGDGGISDSGTIYPNVGGYLPLIDQVQNFILASTIIVLL
jgi:hypothetical protein